MARKRKFGTTDELPSGKVRARYRMPSGEQVTAGTFASQKLADEALDAIEVDIRRGEHWDGRKGKTKFSDFMSEYMELRSRSATPGELSNNRSYLRVHLLPAFGHLRMEQLDEELVDRWYSSMPPTETRRNVYAFLRRSMRFAVKWRYVRSSPCNVLDLANPNTPRPTFTVDDFRKVIERVPVEVRLNNAISPTRVYYREAFELLFATHARLGEIVALNASDVDRKTGTITIDKQVTALGLTTDTKTGQHGSVSALSIGRQALDRLPKGIGAAPLLPGAKATRMPRLALQRAWRAAAIAAGLEDFHLHDIRHVGLTLVASTGATEHDVATRARHANPISTRRYMHPDAARDRTVAEAADRLLEGAGL
jgi:integrase